MSDRMKMLPFRYKMYLNIMRKKGKIEDTGVQKKDESTGAKMGLVYSHVRLHVWDD